MIRQFLYGASFAFSYTEAVRSFAGKETWLKVQDIAYTNESPWIWVACGLFMVFMAILNIPVKHETVRSNQTRQPNA